MAQTAAAGMGKPGVEDWLFATQADTEALVWKAKQRAQADKASVESARRNDARETVANYQAFRRHCAKCGR